MTPLQSSVLYVGDFRVDPALDEISKEGVTTKLEPRAMQLLVCLAERAGQVVSVEQLLDIVWKEVVVSTDSVYQAVASLRRILGDDAKDPKYIANVMRRGYRLVATVESLTEPTAAATPPLEVNPAPKHPLPPERDSRSRLLTTRGLVIALACIAVLGGGWALLREHRGDEKTIGARPTDGKQTVAPSAPITIAVLPFDEPTNESHDAEAAQALAETVRQRLGRSQKMIVVARSSSLAAAGQSADAQAIGLRLGARYLVRGTVESVEHRLRVTAQLLDVESARQLKSFAVDQPIAQVAVLPNDIGGRIAQEVSNQLTGVDLPPPSRSGTTNLDAYLKFLDAQALLDRQTVEGIAQAALVLEQVIKMDPAFALSYSELARARWFEHRDDPKNEPLLLLPLVEKALALDPTLGEAYWVRGMLGSYQKAADAAQAAEADFRKGMELAPNYAQGYELYYFFLASADLTKRAMDMMDRAISIDPLVAHYLALKGFSLSFDMHQSEAGEKLLLQAATLDPDYAYVNMQLAYIKWGKGEVAEGVKFIERALRADSKQTFYRDLACAMYLDLGDRQAAENVAGSAPADSPSSVLLALYDRNFQRAAAHHHDIWNFFEPRYAYWIAVDAAARQSGTIAQTIARLRKEFPLSAVKNGTASPGDYDSALTIMADLLRAQGDAAALAEVLPPLKELLDKNEPRSGLGHGYFELLSGNPDGALALLTIDLHRGHFRGWWILERDPIWVELRSDPRYRDSLAIERKRVEEQRVILERMRQSGDVPRRTEDNHARAANAHKIEHPARVDEIAAASVH